MGVSIDKVKGQTFDLICKIKPCVKQAKKNKSKLLSYISNGYDEPVLANVKTFFEEDDYIFSYKELQPKTYEVLLKWK